MIYESSEKQFGQPIKKIGKFFENHNPLSPPIEKILNPPDYTLTQKKHKSVVFTHFYKWCSTQRSVQAITDHNLAKFNIIRLFVGCLIYSVFNFLEMQVLL